ncbi:alpha-amylase family glycosyl hydrolase [Hymenobacter guriensis]|uniref:Discoidin domain-containing protein n=1 Tax=Hymenobacter guriensis TaxID=2793065 RepID=A0ABS0L6B9_9BACT|nr:alpha-amylase family glycosyl hydrolase [Hymenobacter guriensis]MBG8555649.1 discoidin domain-containing protein [Hymenobacter guriensis]
MEKAVTRVLVVMWMLLGIPLITVQAADLTFNVNLQYRIQQGQFTAGTDQVVVLGSFSAGGVALTDPDGDKIYSGTVTGQTNDAQITYNYRITRGGVQTNESVAARKYVVQPTSAANVLSDWWNDQLPPYPYARFFASSTKTIPGEVVRFNDASEGGAATSWSWSFQGGNPATSSSQNPTVTWGAAGTYAVTLTATNSSGSTTSKTLNVTVTTVDAALGWWNDAIFYQIYPRSFFDTNGNGIGDLQGMTQKLDYLNDGNATTTSDLGVTALYVMPVHDASEPYYGGYQVKDYKSIIGEIGTQADFDAFVAAAHARGIKVILDMVFNHTSDEHPWFQSAAQGAGGKYDDYYVWRSTNPGSAWRNNSIGHSNANFNVYWGKYAVKTPDLNYNSRSVRNTIKDASSFWLGKSVDGFRLDAPMFLYERGDAVALTDQRSLPQTYAYWREWRDHIKAANPNSFSVGETWLFDPVSGPQPSTAIEASKYVYQGFDIGFQFDIAYGVQYALNNENKSYLQTPVEESMNYYPFLQFGTFFSNHDLYTDNSYKALRLKSRLTNNQDAKAKVAAAWLMTAPGVPFVYYGDEVGGGGSNNYARDPMRWSNTASGGFTTGSPWEPAGDYAQYNVQSQQGVAGSFLTLYKDLIKVRKAEASLRRGGYKTVATTSAGVYAFMRTYNSEVTFVILNLAASAQNNVALSVSGTAIPAGTYSLGNLLNGSQTVSSVTVSGGNITNWVPVASIPANGFYVLKLNNGAAGPNAAPTLDAIANQTINLEDGAKAVSLTGISDGNFCTQTVTLAASSANTTVLGAPGVAYTSCNATGTLTLTPLAVGTSSVTVTATDNGGTANGGVNTLSRTFTATVTDIPKAPTGLSLSQASPTSVALSWADNSSRETGYRIYWSTSGTKPATPNVTTAASATSYTATGLNTQTTYNFWVEAYGANGTSTAITGTQALTLPNLALNKTATASSSETFNGVNYTPNLAVDGIDNSFNSRWSTAPSANANQTEWIKIDLGASYALSRVTVSWENANADSYYIMASNSNITPDPANAAWAKVNITGKPNQARFDDQTVAITGRYLAIYPYHKSQPYGYSIYELQAYGLAATGNQAPVANAGPDQSKAAGTTTATLTAAGSTDPEGNPLTYSWTKVSGPAVTFSSTTAVSPTVSGLANGSTYVFQVSVSDGSLSSTDQVQVTVAAANQAPVANAGPDQTLAAGTTSATLTAAASSDPNGQALTYAWTKVSGPAATFSSTTAVSPTVSGLTAGTYVFQVSVSDGALSSTDQVQVVVQASGTATAYYIINRWQNTYLYDNAAQVKYAATASGTAYQWTLETVGSNTRIRNVASGNYMNIEGQTGSVQCTAVPDYFTSGQWTREAVSGTSYFRIRNVWQPGNYLHVENLTGSAQYGAVDASFYSGHWLFQPVAGARTALASASATAAKTPLTLFPNPISQGRLTVLLPSRAASAHLRLLDSQGRTVLDRTAAVTGGQTSLDVTGLTKGLYLLQATTDGNMHTGRVVVE